MHIGSVEKLQLTTIGSPLLIRCKIFLFVTFVIPREKECHEIYVTLQRLYQPGICHLNDRHSRHSMCAVLILIGF